MGSYGFLKITFGEKNLKEKTNPLIGCLTSELGVTIMINYETVMKPVFVNGELCLKVNDRTIPIILLSDQAKAIMPIFLECWKVLLEEKKKL
jgi:hypothetical protein